MSDSVDFDLIAKILRDHGHTVGHIIPVPENAGEYEFEVDGKLIDLEQARELLEREDRERRQRRTSRSSASIVGPLDFTFTVAGASAYTATPGDVASYSFALAPTHGGYAGAVSFTVAGLPPGAVASFTSSVVVADGGAMPVTMTVQTASAMVQTASETTQTVSRKGSNSNRLLGQGAVLGMLLLPFGVNRELRDNLRGQKFLLLLLVAGMTSMVASGASKYGLMLRSPGTYTLTVAATSGTLQHSQTVTLIVQPNREATGLIGKNDAEG